MQHKTVLFGSSTLATAMILAGCNGTPPPQPVASQPPAHPAAKVDTGPHVREVPGGRHFMTSYDYTGNIDFQERVDSFNDSDGVAIGEHDNQSPKTMVSGGGGCTEETLKFDPNDASNAAAFKAIESKGSVWVVMTNGTNKVLLSGKFSNVSNNSGVIDAELNDGDGTTIRDVKFIGGHTLITPNYKSLAPAVRQALEAPAVPQ